MGRCAIITKVDPLDFVFEQSKELKGGAKKQKNRCGGKFKDFFVGIVRPKCSFD